MLCLTEQGLAFAPPVDCKLKIWTGTKRIRSRPFTCANRLQELMSEILRAGSQNRADNRVKGTSPYKLPFRMLFLEKLNTPM